MKDRRTWFLGSAISVLSAAALMGCVAAIPLAINYFATPSGYVATAEVPYPADNVYAAVIREAEGAGRGMTIVKRDDSKCLIEINDGVQGETIKVIEEDDRETQIIVTASKAEREMQKELSLQVLLHLCKEYGEECRVREN